MPQRTPFLSLLILGCHLIQILHCRRWSSLLVKSLEHWARKTNTRLFLDCYLAPTNWCHVGMLYPVEPEPLTDHKKPKFRLIENICVFLRSLHWPNKKIFVAQIWSKDHTFATSKLGKKWICILFGDYRNPKILIHSQRIKPDPIQI